MAGVLQHLRSSTLDKRPNSASMVDGQIAINYASGAPGMFFKDSNGSLVKVGPVHVGSGAPNAVPASGGTAGNSIGEQWLDTSGGTYVFKIWDGAAWRSEAGEFVNATGDTMTGDLVMNNANVVFEGSVDDGFETTLTVVNPTADRTITLPNVTGTVVTTGDSGTVTSTMIANSTIVNADISASAAIAGTKISPDFGSQTIQTTGIISAAAGSAAAPSVAFTGDTNTGIYSPGADQVAISTNGTGRLFVDSSGRLLVGTSSAYFAAASAITAPLFQVHGTNANLSQVLIGSWASGNNVGGSITLARSESGTVGNFGSALSSTDDVLGNVRFNGSDGTKFVEGANISAVVDGAWGTDDAPTKLVFSTTADGASSPTERMRISNAGTTTLTSAASTAPFIANISTSEAARIDSSGRLLVGTSSARANLGNSTLAPQLQVEGTTTSFSSASLIANGTASATNPCARLFLGRSRGSLGTNVVVIENDALGAVSYQGNDGSEFVEAASITAFVDGTPGADNMPGRLVFSTTADGASSPTERMRIDSSGRVGLGTSSATQALQVAGAIVATGAAATYAADGVYLQNKGSSIFDISAWRTGANASILTFSTDSGSDAAPVERMRIGTDGKVGVGTASAIAQTHITSTSAGAGAIALRLENNSATAGTETILQFAPNASGATNRGAQISGLLEGTNGTNLLFYTNPNSASPLERARIDSSGRLLLGTSSARTFDSASATLTPLAQIEATDASSALSITRNSANSSPPGLFFGKSRSGALGSVTAVIANDVLGNIAFEGADGTNLIEAAQIECQVDGPPGANDMPGRLVLSTTLDGASSPTEALRITNDRVIAYNQGAPAAVNATATLTVANLKTGIITSTSAAATDMTLPTGTDTEAGFSGIYTNMTFEWSVINTGPSLVRVLAGTAHTIVGSGSVATGTSGRFASRRTAANTFVTYRLS